MYFYFLLIHSWLRWIVLILLAALLIKFSISLFKKSFYTKVDRVLSSILLGSVHLQFVIGIILYFGLSPVVQAGLSNFKGAMKNPVLRYWTIEHILSMLIFTIFVQVGFSFSKRGVTDNKKHLLMLIFCGIAFLILMLNIPWPFKEYGRMLFRTSLS